MAEQTNDGTIMLVVKFKDDFEIPYTDNAEDHLVREDRDQWEKVVKRFPEVSLRRLFTRVSTETIGELVEEAKRRDPDYSPPNFLSFFAIDLPEGTVRENLERHNPVEELKDLRPVEFHYVAAAVTHPPAVVDPSVDETLAPFQTYLDAPADYGINMRYVWSRNPNLPGAEGQNVKFVDLEAGWNLEHKDLAGAGTYRPVINIISGTRLIDSISVNHGTAVLGVVAALKNDFGVIGIAPRVNVSVVAAAPDLPDAIVSAVAAMTFGDVLLLEVQLASNEPTESELGAYHAIHLATTLGITVVEAAGNGSADLDAIFGPLDGPLAWPFHPDTGAIIVGASFGPGSPLSRQLTSNYGLTRVQCFAQGEKIATTGATSNGLTDPADPAVVFTDSFGGTSGAAAIIAGAAVVLQGIAKNSTDPFRIGPKKMRGLLSADSNTHSQFEVAVDKIGYMPNMESILTSTTGLTIIPDIYIRDYVGDTGEPPHTGQIAGSPDIFVLLTEVTEPLLQSTYGGGSVLADSILSTQVERGERNWVYVRTINRRGPIAANAKATVYWSVPSSLVTPNGWNPVGTTTPLQDIPAGNSVTVFNPIPWDVPTTMAIAHYCFIGIVDCPDDPGEDPRDPTNPIVFSLPDFRRYIIENNNVTWRNFNVVDNNPSNVVSFKYFIRGAPDQDWKMGIQVGANLPAGGRITIDAPKFVTKGFEPVEYEENPPTDKPMLGIELNAHGESDFGEVLLEQNYEHEATLYVHIPDQFRENEYEVYARQLFEGQEVGRVTWHLVTPEQKRKFDRRGHPGPRGFIPKLIKSFCAFLLRIFGYRAE